MFCFVNYPLCLSCYSAVVGERSIVISLSVCLRAYLWNRWTDLHKFCVSFPCGHGSFLLRQHCDMLCISGFMVTSCLAKHGGHTMKRLSRVALRNWGGVWCLRMSYLSCIFVTMQPDSNKWMAGTAVSRLLQPTHLITSHKLSKFWINMSIHSI